MIAQDLREDSAPLDAGTVTKLRTALAAERTVQAVLIDENLRTAEALKGQSDTDSLLEREIAEAAVERAREAIEDIDGALAAMDAGTYGACEACHAPIPLARLEAIPHARYCVACSGRAPR